MPKCRPVFLCHALCDCLYTNLYNLCENPHFRDATRGDAGVGCGRRDRTSRDRLKTRGQTPTLGGDC